MNAVAGQSAREGRLYSTGYVPGVGRSPLSASGGHGHARHPVAIDRLYPSLCESSPATFRGLTLLGEAIDRAGEALRAAEGGDLIGSDGAIMLLRPVIAATFRLRSQFGDGFAAVTSAVDFSLANRCGKPLGVPQLAAICAVLKDLREAPFPQMERAARAVGELDAAGLNPYPATLGGLLAEQNVPGHDYSG